LDDPALIEGRAIHHLVESGLMYRDTIEDVLPIASMRFWESTPFESCAYESIEAYHLAQAKCLWDSTKFLELIGPLEILAIEKEYAAILTDPLTGEVWDDIVIRGIIDLVVNTATGPGVIDIKTLGRSPSIPMAKISLELALYAYLVEYPDYWNARPVEVAFLNLIRTKEPKIVLDKDCLGLEDFETFVSTCRHVAESIKQGKFYKNTGMHCSWCTFKSLCYQDDQLSNQIFGKDATTFYHDTKEINPSLQTAIGF
jgi:hypothetical protein